MHVTKQWWPTRIRANRSRLCKQACSTTDQNRLCRCVISLLPSCSAAPELINMRCLSQSMTAAGSKWQHVYSLLDLKDGESALWRVRRSRASARWRSSGRPGQGRAAETAARLQCAAPFNRHARSCMLAAPAGIHAASSCKVRYAYFCTTG